MQAIRPLGDKVVRMSAQTARIEEGRVYLPESASWLEEFRSEVMAFPNGRHDDRSTPSHRHSHGSRNPKGRG